MKSYENSNLNRRAFAKKHGVAYTTFCLWVRSSLGDEKEMGRSQRHRAKGNEFVEVQVDRKLGSTYSDKRGLIEVRLPTAIAITLSKDYSIKEVAELIQQLGSKPC